MGSYLGYEPINTIVKLTPVQDNTVNTLNTIFMSATTPNTLKYIDGTGTLHTFASTNITSPNSTLVIGTSGSSTTLDLNLAKSNTWTGLQTFSGGFKGELNQSTLNGIPFSTTAPTSGQALVYNGTSWVSSSISSGVSSVSNSDGTLTISPTTGSVVASLNLAHANTWTAQQTFNSGFVANGSVTFNSIPQQSLGTYYNVAFGFQSLYNLASNDIYNTAIGYQALYSATSTNGNTAIGFQALYTNTSGNYNTAVGSASLYNNTGSNNTAVGNGALYFNDAGNYNTAIGVSSLYYIEYSSSYNVGLGAYSLYYLTSGSYNTVIGTNALYGAYAGGFYATGNTVVGYNAMSQIGSSNTSSGANYNTLIGYEVGYNYVADESYNILIGANISGTTGASYQLNIGNLITGNLPGSSNTVGATISGVLNVLSGLTQLVGLTNYGSYIINNILSSSIPTVTVGTSGTVGSYLSANTTYYYGITAVAYDGTESTINGTGSGTEGSTAYPISLSWSSVNYIKQYNIYKGTSSTALYYLASTTSTTYTDSGNIATTNQEPPAFNLTGSLQCGTIKTGGNGITLINVVVPPSGTAMNNLWGYNAILYVSGGAVSEIDINGINTGLTSGTFYLRVSDNITFTYTTAPTVKLQPL